MQLACSICKKYIETGGGRGMRPSLPFVCNDCKAKSKQNAAPAARAPSARPAAAARIEPPAQIAPKQGGAAAEHASDPAQGAARPVSGLVARAEALEQIGAKHEAAGVTPAIPRSTVHGVEAAVHGAPQVNGAVAPPGLAPAEGEPISLRDLDPISLSDIKMILSPGVEPPRLSPPSPVSELRSHEEIEEILHTLDTPDEPNVGAKHELGPVAPTAKPAAPPLPPPAARSASITTARRPPPLPPPQRRSSAGPPPPVPAAASQPPPGAAAPRRSSHHPLAPPPVPAAPRRSSHHPLATASETRPPAGSVPDIELSSPQGGDRLSAAPLAVRSSAVPPTEAQHRARHSGPDPSIWDVSAPQPQRRDRATTPENQTPIETEPQVNSGLIDMRRMAKDRWADAPARGRRASEDVLNLSGGLFGPVVPLGSLAPPLLSAGPEPSPTLDAGHPPNQPTGSPPTTTPAPVVPKPGSTRLKLVGGILAASAVVVGLVLYFVLFAGNDKAQLGQVDPQAISLEAQDRSVRPAIASPATSGAGVADREPTLDDAPTSRPGPSASPTSLQASAAPRETGSPSARRPSAGVAANPQPARPTEPAAARPTPPPTPAAPSPSAGGREFDRAAAKAVLNAAAGAAAGCKSGGPGSSKVAITFAPSGRVTSANIEGGTFAGTPTGGCIANAFRSARVPPFDGGPVTVRKQVSIR